MSYGSYRQRKFGRFGRNLCTFERIQVYYPSTRRHSVRIHRRSELSRWALIFVVEARQRAEGRRQKGRGF
ncbi:MAG: hypothetical protein LDL41_18755, partial [Coleofasciculus sp. S288]|nr:hypothetical protein [Coleofasciculus sp. S288]